MKVIVPYVTATDRGTTRVGTIVTVLVAWPVYTALVFSAGFLCWMFVPGLGIFLLSLLMIVMAPFAGYQLAMNTIGLACPTCEALWKIEKGDDFSCKCGTQLRWVAGELVADVDPELQELLRQRRGCPPPAAQE